MNARLIKVLVCEKEFTNTETEVVACFDYNYMSEEELQKAVFGCLCEFEESFLTTIYEEDEIRQYAKDIVKGDDFYDGDEVFRMIEKTLYY